jgi:hypothetical protein
VYKYKEQSVLELYPNPAQTWVRVGGMKAPATVQIINMDGQVAKQEEITSNTQQLNMADLPPGIYILQTNGQRKKLVKTE